MLCEVEYLPSNLVTLEVGVVIFLHIMEDHQLNDALHVTPFSSQWQLAPFYKTGVICSSLR